MPGQQDRQPPTATADSLNDSFQAAQGIAVQVVGIIGG